MKIFDQKFANFLHNLKKIYKNIQQNTKKRYPLNFFLEKIYKNNKNRPLGSLELSQIVIIEGIIENESCSTI